MLYGYSLAAEGIRVLVDGLSKGELLSGVVTEPGKHQLQLQNARTHRVLYQGDIALRAGERANVADLIAKPAHLEVALEAVGLLPLNST